MTRLPDRVMIVRVAAIGQHCIESVGFCVLAFGCGPTPRSEDGRTGTGTSAQPDLPSDAPEPYQRCNDACRDLDLVGFYCPSCGNCGPDFASYSVCATDCDALADCGPAPQGERVVCAQHSCFISCETEDCPDGMKCIDFGHEDLVCMFP